MGGGGGVKFWQRSNEGKTCALVFRFPIVGFGRANAKNGVTSNTRGGGGEFVKGKS